MSSSDAGDFVLFATTRGAADAPEEVLYRRSFEREDRRGEGWRPVGSAGPEVERLLAPLGAERFVAEHVGRAIAHLKGGAPRRFDDLFSFRRMATMLAEGGLPPEQIDVFSAARRRVPRAEYTYTHASRGGLRLAHDALLSLVGRERGSMVLNAVEAHDRRISDFAWALHAWSGLRVNVNAYLTHAEGKTFGWHWDGHDVFILQVEGRKRWRLFAPVMSHPLADGSGAAFHELRAERSEPRGEVILEQGDVLYLPGGVPHDVDALDQSSLHLAVGLSPPRWSEVAQTSFAAAMRTLVQRSAVRAPVGTGADEGALRERYLGLVSAIGELMASQELDRVLAVTQTEHTQSSVGRRAARWRWMFSPRTLSAGDRLGLCSPDVALVPGAGFVTLRVGDVVLVLEDPAKAAIERLVAAREVRVDELVALSSGEQIRLARALVEHGVVALVEERSGAPEEGCDRPSVEGICEEERR